MSSTEKNLVIHQALIDGKKILTELDAHDFLANYDLPLARTAFAKNKDELTAACQRIGFPLVMKVVSPQILHKSDVGGVIVNIRNIEEARSGYDQILNNARRRSPGAVVKGVLVQEMAKPSIEVIVGGVRDPQFGPVVMFGLGGIFVELFKDVSFGLAPLSEGDASRLIREVKGYRLLAGYRGKPAVDIGSLLHIIVKVSELTATGLIEEIDLNPVAVYSEGAMVLDAKMSAIRK